MNAITTRASAALPVSNDDAIRVLQNSLYPGARRESVELVLAWCRATGRDPMKKPIHIVPMWVRDAATGKGEMRDVLMPGIGTYRSDAASSGQYAGKTEPEFGPEITRDIDGMKVTFPQWCKVTVLRLVGGQERRFTATEYWMENYASGKEKKGVNDMWRKRPYGQLGKCSESQALRMAFPDETGNTNTAEEMEGKGFEGMTLDAAPEPRSVAAPRPTSPRPLDAVDADTIPALDAEPQPPRDEASEKAARLIARIEAAATEDDLHAIAGDPGVAKGRAWFSAHRPELEQRIAAAFGDAYARLTTPHAEDDDLGFPGVASPREPSGAEAGA